MVTLTERLGKIQHYHQSLAFAHDRMQERLGKVLELLPANVVAANKELIRRAKWEATRGTAIRETNDYLFTTTPENNQALPAGGANQH